MDTQNMQGFEAEGFSFPNQAEAKTATKEKKQVDYIESKLNYAELNQVYSIYEKAIADQIFRTPVGVIYLKHLQNYLNNHKDKLGKEITPIPVRTVKNIRRPDTKEEIAKRKWGVSFSITLNVLLAMAVAFMFYVALSSDNPNILNYENALENRYSAWEQELTQREQVIREKELELKIGE